MKTSESTKEKRRIKSALKRVNKHLEKADAIFFTIPSGIRNEIHEVHGSDTSLNHCLRWGLQASEELLEKKTFDKVVEDYL